MIPNINMTEACVLYIYRLNKINKVNMSLNNNSHGLIFIKIEKI